MRAMPMSPYLAELRRKVGPTLVLMPAAGLAIFDDRGRILLGRHVDRGGWATIGGAMDPGESPLAAALRELAEEAGLQARPLGIIDAYGGPEFEVTYADGNQVAYVVTMFAAQLLPGEPVLQAEEIDELRWFDQADALELDLRPDMARIVPDAFDWWGTHHRRFTGG